MINLFQDVLTYLSPENVKCMVRGIPQDHVNKISRPSNVEVEVQ